MRQGGFTILDRLLHDDLFAGLRAEAIERYAEATESRAEASDDEPWRGGSPARRFLSASGGPVQDAFYHAQEIGEAIADLGGVAIRPAGARGSFSYYVRPGDHLAIHRDIVHCDLAVITCLYETHPAASTGKLVVYPGRSAETLQSIRATPNQGCMPLTLLPAQTAMLFGGIVPHQILPLAGEQMRIVSVLCFEVMS